MQSARAGNQSAPLLIADVELVHVPAGLCEKPLPADAHCLSINTGRAVWATCRHPGPARRHFRASGGMNFVPAGMAIAWLLDAPLDLLRLSVPRDLIRSAANELELDARTLDFSTAIQVCQPQVEWLARALHAESVAGNPNGRLFSESLGLALSIAVIQKFTRSAASLKTYRGRLAPLQLKRVEEYVESNLGRQDLSLAQLAAVTGMSISHFKALFKRSVGVAPHRFILQRRVERAAELLRRGQTSITNIAAETGFAHAAHMARWTRRLLGVGPAKLCRRDPAGDWDADEGG